MKKQDFSMVYGARKQIIGNFKELGVIDSTYNIKTILKDAISVSNLLINNAFMITKQKVYTPSSMKDYKHLAFL